MNKNISIYDDSVFSFDSLLEDPVRGKAIVYVMGFDTPFIWNESSLSEVFFDDFRIFHGVLKIQFQYIRFEIPLNDGQILSIREKEALEIYPYQLNFPISPNDSSLILLYYADDAGYYLLKVFESELFILDYSILETLRLHKYSDVDVQVSQLITDGVLSEYVPISESQSRLNPLKVITLVVKSRRKILLRIGNREQAVGELSETPLKLILWGLLELQKLDLAHIRRLVNICSNSGVPVDLIGKITLLGVSSSSLERFGLPLHSWASQKDSVINDPVVMFALHNLINHIETTDSEATLRSVVWDTMLNAMFLGSNLPNFSCVSEWYAGEVLSRRIADWAVVLKSEISDDAGNLPVFLVEMSNESVRPGGVHKDYTKLMCLLSQTCFRLCRHVYMKGGDPRVVRTFGMLVGHAQFQLIVAHPVFSRNERFGRTEISIHLSTQDHWRFDLFRKLDSDDDQEPNCQLSCCAASFAQIIPGSVAINVPGIPSQVHNASIVEFISEDIQDLAHVDLPHVALNRGEIDWRSVCTLKLFTRIVLDSIGEISTQIVGGPSISRAEFDRYFPDSLGSSPIGHVASSRPSHDLLTPDQSRTLAPLCTDSRSLNFGRQVEFIEIQKDSFEFNFYSTILNRSKNAIYFPRVYTWRDHPKRVDSVVLEMEKMFPLLKDHGLDPEIVRMDSVREIIIEGATFAVHVLFELIMLHEDFHTIHGHLSPNSFKFSPTGNIWKMHDFAMLQNRTEHDVQTLQTFSSSDVQTFSSSDMDMRTFSSSDVCTFSSFDVHPDGLPPFLAPESAKSGLFTPEADIYALGQVLLQCWYLSGCLGSLSVSAEDDCVLEKFRRISAGMSVASPQHRLSAREALRLFNSLIKEFNPNTFPLRGEGSIMAIIDCIISE